MAQNIQIGIIGGGSWATALAKILTDNGNKVHWWMRNNVAIKQIQSQGSNPGYLPAVHFDTGLLTLCEDLRSTIEQCSLIILAIPSLYLKEALSPIQKGDLRGKIILSAIKGLISDGMLVNEFLQDEYDFSTYNYYTVMGPCHAEEVAAEKLSYLTFSGSDDTTATAISDYFRTRYIKCIVNSDIRGVQYAAVVKNVYALGAGIAHGLGYGDNFLSVYISNCIEEMDTFLMQEEIQHIRLGKSGTKVAGNANYSASVYLGDLLVTCYSPHSRNRTFGSMIGKGYSIKAAVVEMGMLPEGYNAAKSIYGLNRNFGTSMIIAETVYQILWNELSPKDAFLKLEGILV